LRFIIRNRKIGKHSLNKCQASPPEGDKKLKFLSFTRLTEIDFTVKKVQKDTLTS